MHHSAVLLIFILILQRIVTEQKLSKGGTGRDGAGLSYIRPTLFSKRDRR